MTHKIETKSYPSIWTKWRKLVAKQGDGKGRGAWVKEIRHGTGYKTCTHTHTGGAEGRGSEREWCHWLLLTSASYQLASPAPSLQSSCPWCSSEWHLIEPTMQVSHTSRHQEPSSQLISPWMQRQFPGGSVWSSARPLLCRWPSSWELDSRLLSVFSSLPSAVHTGFSCTGSVAGQLLGQGNTGWSSSFPHCLMNQPSCY